MVTVVTVASRAAGRTRLAAEHAAIFFYFEVGTGIDAYIRQQQSHTCTHVHWLS
jgi:hypothetical protein